MARLQLIKINPDGSEVILEITPVPDNFTGYYSSISPDHIRELEEHYKRTGEPKKSYIDAMYIIRRQIER